MKKETDLEKTRRIKRLKKNSEERRRGTASRTTDRSKREEKLPSDGRRGD